MSDRSTNAVKGKVSTNYIRTLPLSLLRHKLTIQCTDLPGWSKFGISRIFTVIYIIFSGERQHFDSGESRNPPRYLSVHGVDFKIVINVSYFYFSAFFFVTVCLLTHCRLVNKKRTLLQTEQVSMYPVCAKDYFFSGDEEDKKDEERLFAFLAHLLAGKRELISCEKDFYAFQPNGGLFKSWEHSYLYS